MEKEFVIRSYGYCELAMLYFPNSTKKSASVQFRRWIVFNKKLESNLIEAGYERGKRVFTPKQVQIIIETLGNP
jgi:hypothetical protein